MPSSRILILPLGLAIAIAGCERNGEQLTSALPDGPTREIVYPITGFANHAPRRSQLAGSLVARVIQTPEGARRALMSRGASTLRLSVGRRAGGLLRATLGVLPGGPRDPIEHALFAVRVERRGAETSEDLLTEWLATGESKAISVPLPDDASHVTLITEPERNGPARAVWIEPELARREARPRPPPGAASLLLITADTTRADELSLYGGPVAVPALEALAVRGITFDDAHSVAFGTTPSHASIFTARPAALHGLIDNRLYLPGEEHTLAEVLREAGWHTGAFVSAIPVSRELGFAQGFDVFDDVFISDPGAALPGTARFERRGAASVDALAAWLAGVPDDEPVFAWLHLFDPHQPYAPPARHAGAVPAPPPGRVDWTRLHAASIERDAPGVFEDVAARARALYRGELAALDEAVGRAVAAVRARRGDAAILFVGDHGENFDERSRALAFDHAGLHAEVTRLPLVLEPPASARLPVDRRVDWLVPSTDLAPTLLDLLGLHAPEEWVGTSLVAALREAPTGEPPRLHEHLVLEGAGRREIAVRSRRWLYREPISALASDKAELFDLRADPQARRDVAAEHPDERDRLADAARRVRASWRERERPELSPEVIEALEALGYLE